MINPGALADICVILEITILSMDSHDIHHIALLESMGIDIYKFWEQILSNSKRQRVEWWLPRTEGGRTGEAHIARLRCLVLIV
jgi:hypothetical protein